MLPRGIGRGTAGLSALAVLALLWFSNSLPQSVPRDPADPRLQADPTPMLLRPAGAAVQQPAAPAQQPPARPITASPAEPVAAAPDPLNAIAKAAPAPAVAASAVNQPPPDTAPQGAVPIDPELVPAPRSEPERPREEPDEPQPPSPTPAAPTAPTAAPAPTDAPPETPAAVVPGATSTPIIPSGPLPTVTPPPPEPPPDPPLRGPHHTSSRWDGSRTD